MNISLSTLYVEMKKITDWMETFCIVPTTYWPDSFQIVPLVIAL